MLKNKKISTRQAAKETGFILVLHCVFKISIMDDFLCRKHVAVLFGPTADSSVRMMSAIKNIFDSLIIRSSHKAPVIRKICREQRIGFLRLALSAEEFSSGFSKSMRNLTEHRKIEYPAQLLWRQRQKDCVNIS